MKPRLLLGILALLLVPVMAISGQDKSPLKLIQKVPMPNVKGRLDHFGLDSAGQRLFVAALGDDQNTVEVIDLKSGKWISSIPGQSKPQGLFYSPDFKNPAFPAHCIGKLLAVLNYRFSANPELSLRDYTGTAHESRDRVAGPGRGVVPVVFSDRIGFKLAPCANPSTDWPSPSGSS